MSTPRAARSERAAPMNTHVRLTTARGAGGVPEKAGRRHALADKYKQFLRSTDDLAIASIGYPGGICELIAARETAVALLVQLMRA